MDSLTELLRFRQDKPCIVDGSRSLSYRELDDESARLASFVARSKVSRILVFLPNSWQFVVSMYGVLKSGATCIPIDYRSTARELKFFIENSKSDLIITSRSKSDFVEFFPNRIEIETEPSSSPFKFANETVENYEVVKVNPALLLYTGGTTGFPKGVMLSHENILHVLASLSKVWQMREGEELVCQVLPMTHSGGLNCGVNCAIFNGGTTVILRKFDPKALLDLIEKHRITAFAGVPTIYNSLTRVEDIGRRDLSSLRICFSSGAALSPETAKIFKEKTGITITAGWGLTEASPQLTVSPRGVFKENYVGLPLPQTEVVAMDDQKQILGKGVIGELAAKGPQVMMGYWQEEQETKKTITSDGWLLTGDIGYVSDDGVYLVGRRKETINSGGYKIWPNEIEHVLMENEHVLEAAVIGSKDEYFGEIVKAFVVLKSDATEKELAEFCRDRLSSYKVPKVFEFRESLPKSSVGKILRLALAEEDSSQQKNQKVGN